MSIFEAAISWLAPVVCIGCGQEGTTFCQSCLATEIIPFGERCYLCNKMSPANRTCLTCRKSSPSHVWITTDYRDYPKDLIQKLKFQHQRAAARPIAEAMADTLATFNLIDELIDNKYLIIPIPTATSRVRERSFDHTALLAKEISKNLKLETSSVLKRLGQSRQVGAKRHVRREQAAGNYYLFQPTKVKGRHIILVDDVVTTGATLRAATVTLRRAGAHSVDALVFAKKL